MMVVVFDTDVISTFGKIKRLDLLQKLFPRDEFFIPSSVYDELINAQELGYEFAKYVIESELFKALTLSDEERDFVDKLQRRKSLGSGEKEAIALCKYRKYALITNDDDAKDICDKNSMEFFDLSMLLKTLWKSEIMSKEKVAKLIDEIETQDKVKIKDKERIIGD